MLNSARTCAAKPSQLSSDDKKNLNSASSIVTLRIARERGTGLHVASGLDSVST
jgi:hypothetical protein